MLSNNVPPLVPLILVVKKIPMFKLTCLAVVEDYQVKLKISLPC